MCVFVIFVQLYLKNPAFRNSGGCRDFEKVFFWWSSYCRIFLKNISARCDLRATELPERQIWQLGCPGFLGEIFEIVRIHWYFFSFLFTVVSKSRLWELWQRFGVVNIKAIFITNWTLWAQGNRVAIQGTRIARQGTRVASRKKWGQSQGGRIAKCQGAGEPLGAHELPAEKKAIWLRA